MSAKKTKILLVEDEPELAEMFGVALKNAGYDTQVVNDGLSAVEAIVGGKPDLVLLDLVIPKLDGYGVLEKVKKDKSVKSKIFAWSNLTQADEIERAKKLGVDDYLVKSDFTPAKFVEKIREIVGEIK